jgi:hypothetical protein
MSVRCAESWVLLDPPSIDMFLLLANPVPLQRDPDISLIPISQGPVMPLQALTVRIAAATPPIYDSSPR